MTRPTLKDVAQRAGVSHATASKALNGRTEIAEETRALVARAASELGYLPRRASADGRDRPLVTLLTDSIESYYSVEVLRGMIEEGSRRGIDVVPRIESRSSRRALSPWQWEREFLRPDVMGIVLLVYGAQSPVLEVAAHRGVPVVAIDPYVGCRDATTTISSTNWEGGKAATEHLLELGHRRIALINGTPDFLPGNERLHGYRAALLDAGFEVDESLIFEGAYTYGSGFDAAERMLEMPDRPTAVFALSDRMALGAIGAFVSRGVRVPEDVSVVGFDNAPGVDLATPRLTTVNQPRVDMGRMASKTLADLAGGAAGVSERMKLSTNLIVRASTALARSGAA